MRRLEVKPQVAILFVGQSVQPAAIALDARDVPVPGIPVRWTARSAKGEALPVDSAGAFIGVEPGDSVVTAQDEAGHAAQLTVTVVASTAGNAPPRSGSYSAALMSSGNARGAPTANLLPGGNPSYDSDVAAAVFRPINQRGWKANEPVRPSRAGPVSGAPRPRASAGEATIEAVQASVGEYSFDVPLSLAPARGLNLPLGLHYSAKVWTLGDTEAVFDVDGDWPAPGFNISLGKLVLAGDQVIFIDSEGVRHPVLNTGLALSSTQSGYMQDGTLMYYSITVDGAGLLTAASVWYPNGTRLDFGAGRGVSFLAGSFHVIRITDSNGNYALATYVGNVGPQLDWVQDSVGRAYRFNYTNNLLSSVTGPGLNFSTRTLVKLHYVAKTISKSFVLPARVNGADASGQRWLIDAIVFGDGTGYAMTASDAYSPYGIIRRLEQRTGMALNASGALTLGKVRSWTLYDYPIADSTLGTPPLWGNKTSWWDGTDVAGAGTTLTTTTSTVSSNFRTTTVTNPDGSKGIRISYEPSGLTTETRVVSPSGTVLRKTTYTYTKYAVAPVPLATSITTWEYGAGAAAARRTDFGYGAGPQGLGLQRVWEYDFDQTTVLRRTETAYVTDSKYASNHILNLPLSRTVKDGAFNVVERTEFGYDAQVGQGLVNPQGNTAPLPSSVFHDTRYDPYAASGCGTSCYLASTDARGNVSTVKRYAAPASSGGLLTTSFTYDVLGNVVRTVAEDGMQTRTDYAGGYIYAFPTQVTLADKSTTPVITSATYDLATGLLITRTDAAGKTTAYAYADAAHPDALRLQSVTFPTGAHEDYGYDDANLTVTTTTYKAAGTASLGSQVTVRQTGLGSPKRTTTLTDTSLNDLVDFKYDALGRQVQQSLPYRVPSTPVFATTGYDALGRTVSSAAPDGSTSTWEYQPNVTLSGQPVGLTVLERSAWKAERWLRRDALGRLVAAVEAKNTAGPSASVSDTGILSTYSYDLLDNMLSASAAGRTHRFVYDGLSRLVAQALAERNATLDATGTYQGAGGTYSDVFGYDLQGRLARTVDARGAATTLDYGQDALGRLQAIRYSTADVGDAHPVLPAGDVTYTYCPYPGTVDCPTPLLPKTESTASTTSGTTTWPGVTRTFTYDDKGRPTAIATAYSDRPGFSFSVGYGYDTLSRVTSTTYPTEYGLNRTNRKVAGVVLDALGRPKSLTFGTGTTPPSYAQSVTYHPTGGMATATIGFGSYVATQTWTYEAVSGLLQSQKVVPSGGSATMDVTYGYADSNIPGGPSRTGKLKFLTDNRNAGRNRSYDYDSLGRLIKVTGGASAWSQTYSYDDAGNRTSVTAAGSIALDGLAGGLTFSPQQNRVVGWEYDDSGNLIQGKSDDATTQRYEYDAAGRLVRVSQLQSTAAPATMAMMPLIGDHCTGNPNCNFNGCPGLKECTDPPLWGACVPTGPKACTAACGARGHQDCYTDGTFGACIRDTGACCTGSGNACTFTNGCPGTLDCNAVCTPTAAGAQGGQACQLANGCGGTYDCSGNCVPLGGTANAAACTSTLGNPGHENCTAQGVYLGCQPDSAAQRVEACNGRDDDGDGIIDNNPGNPSPSTLTQSCANACGGQGTQTCTSGGTWGTCSGCALVVVETYTYGASRERLKVKDEASGKSTYYVRSAQGVVAEYTEASGATAPTSSKQYVYLNGRLLASLKPSGTSDTVEWYHHDRLGVRLIATSSTSTKEQATLPFGTALTSESTGSISYRLTSYDRSSSTKLDYAVNRYYSSSQGRFTQVDPLGPGATSTGRSQSLNSYSYSGGDPINHLDPLGLRWIVTTVCSDSYDVQGGGSACSTTAYWEDDAPGNSPILGPNRNPGGEGGGRQGSQNEANLPTNICSANGALNQFKKNKNLTDSALSSLPARSAVLAMNTALGTSKTVASALGIQTWSAAFAEFVASNAVWEAEAIATAAYSPPGVFSAAVDANAAAAQALRAAWVGRAVVGIGISAAANYGVSVVSFRVGVNIGTFLETAMEVDEACSVVSLGGGGPQP